jgi:chitinase
MAILRFLSLLGAFVATAQAGFSASSKSNVVIYWGQNSAGQQSTQTRLSNYCAGTQVDI